MLHISYLKLSFQIGSTNSDRIECDQALNPNLQLIQSEISLVLGRNYTLLRSKSNGMVGGSMMELPRWKIKQGT